MLIDSGENGTWEELGRKLWNAFSKLKVSSLSRISIPQKNFRKRDYHKSNLGAV